jgi:ABC-2 type transport system ATP-binding protein
VSLTARQRNGTIVQAVGKLAAADIDVDDLTMRRPTLDDVFLTLTGHAAEDVAESEEEEEAAA